MERHFTLVGILNIVYSAFILIAGILVTFGLVGGAGLIDDPEAARFTSNLGSLIGVLLMVASLPGIIGGIGMLQRKHWARIPLMIVAATNLLNLPLGTALGIYTLWVLMKPEAKARFI